MNAERMGKTRHATEENKLASWRKATADGRSSDRMQAQLRSEIKHGRRVGMFGDDSPASCKIGGHRPPIQQSS
jgi:hypothetical protein